MKPQILKNGNRLFSENVMMVLNATAFEGIYTRRVLGSALISIMFPPVEKINFKCHLFNCLLCLIKNGNLFDLFVAYVICRFIKEITET